jgi:drug/metabolite transporter superfamily protein YnfA
VKNTIDCSWCLCRQPEPDFGPANSFIPPEAGEPLSLGAVYVTVAKVASAWPRLDQWRVRLDRGDFLGAALSIDGMAVIAFAPHG